MKLYTSYFAQLRNFPPNLVGLSTAVWNPKWRPMGKDKRGVICMNLPPLKPGKKCEGLCNGKCNPKHPQDCKFLKQYWEQLNEINFEEFMEKLFHLKIAIEIGENLDEEVEFAFLVYETPQNPCSERTIIQKWFHENGIEIEEWHK